MKNTLIIAEAGVNHNGDLRLAKKLIDAASSAGADFVKFQTFKSTSLATKIAKKAKYQMACTSSSENQYDMLKKLELSEAMHDQLIEYCNTKKIGFLSTPFDYQSADFLENKVPFYKIPSGEITNLPFIEYLAMKSKPIVMSTGMSSLNEVKIAANLIKETWDKGKMNLHLTVLHCVTAYPTPIDQVNLLAMNTMKQLNVEVGYSDHTLGIEVPIAAVALGAKIIEKHLTLDRSLPGPDHIASLEPDEFKSMVISIRKVESCLGNGVKQQALCEQENMAVARRGLYFSKNLKKGDIIQVSDIAIKRPTSSLEPSSLKNIIGKKLYCDVLEDQAIETKHLL